MWAKYANEHKGYCLEFRHKGDSLFASAQELVYSETVGLELSDPDDTPNWYFYKSAEWSNEEEVRIVMPPAWEPVVQIFPLTLSGIILGEKVDAANVKRVNAAASRRLGFTVRQARFDRHEGALVTTMIYTSPDA
jgi:hypothetical protein